MNQTESIAVEPAAPAPPSRLAALGTRLQTELARVIVGQEAACELLVVALLARGHVLLEGVPGLAKTLLAKTLARLVGGEYRRVQFTPDLMPTDITGTNVYDLKASEFYLKRGPVFTNFLLADEINRTPPKTQAALLEAMEERRVTLDGIDHVLTEPFFVVATQNPIEYEGTYPLPEAQLDRFLMKVLVSYPSASDEVEVFRRTHQGFDPHDLAAAGVEPICSADEFAAIAREADQLIMDEALLHYISELVRRTRTVPQVVLGASPRAGIALLRCGKALAALRGRGFVTPDDVKTLAGPILRHRLLLQPEAELEGLTPDQVIANVLGAVPVPR